MDNRFNLIDEPWIPIADCGRVSLGQLFANPDYRALGGNPVQKIALMKLLLAIAQAAATPDDETGWQAMCETSSPRPWGCFSLTHEGTVSPISTYAKVGRG